MVSQSRRRVRLSPRAPLAAGGQDAVELPDDVVAAVVLRLQGPEDTLRVRAVNRQWRRVAQRQEILAHQLRRLGPGALDGLAPGELPLELRRQAQVAHNFRVGQFRGQDCQLPTDLTMLHLGRSRAQGPFLVGQSPAGCARLWPLAGVQAAPRRVAEHPGPLTSLSISADGTHIASAASPPSLRGPSPARGSVQLWRQAAPDRPVTLSDSHCEHVAAMGVAAGGQAVVAYLPAPGGCMVRVWHLSPDGEARGVATLSCPPLRPPAVTRLARWAEEGGARGLLTASSMTRTPYPSRAAAHAAAEPEAGAAGGRELHMTALPPQRAPADVDALQPGARLLVVAGRAGLGPSFERAHPAAQCLGERHDWRSCLMSACGKVVVSRRAGGAACIWHLYW